MSQRARVLSVIALTMLPVIALAGVSIWTQLADTEMRITRERVALARAAAFATESFVHGHLSAARSLALHPALAREQSTPELLLFLKLLAADHPDWNGIGVTGPDGRTRFIGSHDGAYGVPRSMEAAAAGRPAVVVAAPVGHRAGPASIVITVPIEYRAGGRGALIVPVAARGLADRLTRSIGGPSAQITIIDGEARSFVDTDGARVRVLASMKDSAEARAVLAGGAGSLVVQDAGVPMLAAYAPVSPYGWGVILTEPVMSVFAPARRSALERAGLLLAGLAVAAVLGWHLGGRLGLFYQRAVQAHAEAEAARASLQLAIDARDRFLATLSHELRNPLAPISNAVAILEQGEPAHASAARGIIRRQLANMVRLIDDLLEVTRISTGKLRLQKQRMDLALAVRDAVETAEPALRARNHALEISQPAEPAYVHADRTRLSQVVGNLLNNAAKFTAPGGRIRVAIERAGEEAAISVEDNGIGIEPAHLESIFEMFEQLEPSPEKEHGGLGVGLAVVRCIVEMHCGTVSAHSDGPGRGSEFVVRLPAVA